MQYRPVDLLCGPEPSAVPAYKLSRQRNERQTVPTARKRNTLDGDRRWRERGFDLEDLIEWKGAAAIDMQCEGGDDILPFELVDRKSRATQAEQRLQNRAQAAWFRARGINPGDWNAVYPELKKAWAAYGIETMEDRLRRMSSEAGDER